VVKKEVCVAIDGERGKGRVYKRFKKEYFKKEEPIIKFKMPNAVYV
jgi:hypothetical protein